MSIPCLSLAVKRLQAVELAHYAIWIFQAPHPGGRVHDDRIWSQSLTDTWNAWQNVFLGRGLPNVPRVSTNFTAPPTIENGMGPLGGTQETTSYSSQLMQHMGVSLWGWLFGGSVRSSFDHSRGIAVGLRQPLRLRLEIQDPALISLPWEVMQPPLGKVVAIDHQNLLFSRTTSDVDPLPHLRTEQSLKILIVLGQDDGDAPDRPSFIPSGSSSLQLRQEADTLARILENSVNSDTPNFIAPVECHVQTLVEPTPAELIHTLESGTFNVFFYSGHGITAPDGGQLVLRLDARMTGTELAQVLTRCQVKLAVFNACWGAQPDYQDGQAIPRSSLAEVLIHYGVPAVLGMRESIADHEAISFIQSFARALAERAPIDKAVAIARQDLLTLYKFNQPAWTLPILYMHPDFDGELIKPIVESVTEIPENSPSWIRQEAPPAFLRSTSPPHRKWHIQGGVLRIGKVEGNDMIVPVPGVSRQHAEIYYRDAIGSDGPSSYILRDRSRYGTFLWGGEQGWQPIHQRDVPLSSGARIRFGSLQAEFIVEDSSSSKLD